jgi:hypothetical protein
MSVTLAYAVLGKDARTAVRELMALPPSKELELPPTAGSPSRRLLAKLGLDSEQLTN